MKNSKSGNAHKSKNNNLAMTTEQAEFTAKKVHELKVKAYQENKWIDWESLELVETLPAPKPTLEEGDNRAASPDQAWA